MQTVLPIHAVEPFGPETLEAMDWAFKAAIVRIENGEPLLDANWRELIALRIVETAQRGIRDRQSLCDDAVEHYRTQRAADA
jgi:hypothetical protein